MGINRQFAALAISFTVGAMLFGATAALGQGQPPSEFDVPSNLDVYFIDKNDAGDDPWKPGCHLHYGTKDCRAPEFFFAGDSCSPDGRILFEWTNSKCHEAEDDIKRYDCESLCRKKYGTPGRCVVAAKACRSRNAKAPNTTRDSASCVCQETR